MRQIKFRAKTATTQRWAYGHYAFVQGYHVIYEDGEPFVIVRSTLCQYIGLTDKNRLEIYEGDIVKLDIWQGQEDNYIDLVTHDVVTGRPSKHIKKIGELKKDIFGGLYIKDFYLLNLEIADKYEFEVIGTIYENPELLECETE